MDTLPQLSPKQTEALDVLVDLFTQSRMCKTLKLCGSSISLSISG
jgi:hypothetical protein